MIERIEIQYFRSIYKVLISKTQRLNVFTGKNDVGKSNVLKALNLFFNNCVQSDGDYTFENNYNFKRLEEVRKDTIKGKQFIQIKITFRRGKQYEKTLMPLCSDMTDIAKGLAGLGALFYVALRGCSHCQEQSR